MDRLWTPGGFHRGCRRWPPRWILQPSRKPPGSQPGPSAMQRKSRGFLVPSGDRWLPSGGGGFPKIWPCRWRSIALRPPAYDFRQEGPANSSGSGTKAATRAPLPRIARIYPRTGVFVSSKSVRRTLSASLREIAVTRRGALADLSSAGRDDTGRSGLARSQAPHTRRALRRPWHVRAVLGYQQSRPLGPCGAARP